MLFENVVDTIGGTPLIKLNKIESGKNTQIYLKTEFFNPGGSIKDRTALYMLKEAKKRGEIDQNTVIIEPTSGNTGIGLAVICAVWASMS